MGGKITSALSRETRELLKDNKYFYDSVTNLLDSTGLKFKPADGESKTEVEQLQDGKLAVHFLIPLDGNGDASDGRIYLRDTFIFDEKQKVVHEHNRSFEYNGRGENKAEWQKWLAIYKEKAGGSIGGQPLATFAATAALSFSRPFSDKQFELFKKLNNKKIKVDVNGQEEEQKNPNYLAFYEGLVGTAYDLGLSLRSRDSRSSYAVLDRGLMKELVFTFAILNADGSPGHLLVKESFLINKNTNTLVGHSRKTVVPPELSGDKDWNQRAEALNAVATPDLEKARAFIGNFIPDILNDAPEFKPASVSAEDPQSYPELTEAAFRKTMGAMARSRKTPALGEMHPAFFETLAKEETYLAPLREAMGSGFALNLKDPPLKTSVQVIAGKTQIFVTYSLKPSSGQEGVLEYSERWTFEKGQLTAVDRQAKALGAPQGGEVEVAAQHVKEAIQGGKFGDVKQETTYKAVANQAAFLAPHLAYIGVPTLLEDPRIQGQLTPTQRAILPIASEIQSDLISVFYANDVDSHFRDDILRINAAFLHGDDQTMAALLDGLQKREQAAIAAAKDPEQKQRHVEQLNVADLIFTLATGDVDKAHEVSKRLVSPAYKRVFDKALNFTVKGPKVMEGLGLISQVVEEQIQLGEKSGKGLLGDAARYSSTDRDALKSLVAKSLGGIDKQIKSADCLKVLQASLDYGKGKKPEEMNEQEKALLLTEGERALATKIMADPIVKKLANLAMEEDRDLQAKQYFEFARGTLFEKGLFQSSRVLVDIVTQKMPKNPATESLEILRTYAMEKSENEKVAKLKALPPQAPELNEKAIGGFLNKLKQKAQDDPTKPFATLLGELGDLSDEEKKLLDRLKKSPSFEMIGQAAAVPTAAERHQAYISVVAPYLVDQLLLDDVVAALEKDPKQSLKKVFEGIPDLRPEQAQLFGELEQAGYIPQIEQKLAAAVSMDPAQRGNYYRTTLAGFLPDLYASQEAQASLAFIAKEEKQLPAIEGVAAAGILLAGEIQHELRPQMKALQGHERTEIEQQKAIQSLLSKAAATAPMNPVASAYTLLTEMKESDLSAAEKEMRKKLLEDKSISAILEIGAEPDIVKRREAYLKHLQNMETGEAGTLAKAGYAKTDMWLAQQVHLGKIPDIHGYIEMPALMMGETPGRKHLAAAGAIEHREKLVRDVKKFMSMLEGKGDFGTKFGHGLPHFTKELFKPTSIAAMMAAPLAGGAVSLRMAAWLKNLGVVGRGIGVGTGVAAEAATFTYLHAQGEKHVYGNLAPEQNLWKDMKSNMLLFAAMRGVHLGTAAFGEKVLATGRLGQWAGSPVAGESAGALRTLPTKQMVWMPASGGNGVPQLTVAGERVVGVLNHGGAVAAMYYTPRLVNAFGGNVQAPGLDDTLLMYVHAIAGYNIANAASGGRLNMGMADLNMRMANLRGAGSVEGIRQQIVELDAKRTELVKSKEGLNDAAKGEVDGKILKVDGQILGLRKKLTKLEKPADKAKPGDKKNNGDDLIQLFESKPEQVVLNDVSGHSQIDPAVAPGPVIEVRPLKAGEKISLDSHLLGREGSDIVIERNAKGELVLRDNQSANKIKTGEPKDGSPEYVEMTEPSSLIPLEHNGKVVTEPVVLAKGDVVSAGGKEIRIGLDAPSALQQAMARVPRAQQLSLARQIGKAKKISELFKSLRDSAHGGAGEVMMITAEVLSGRRSVESLPAELGIRSKVRSLIESQVKEWQKEGLSIEGHSLKDGALPADATPLEADYHTLRAVIALKGGVEGSRTMYELLQALGQSTLQTVGGASTQQIFDSLGLENARGLLDQVTKTEVELREKIRLLERGINREKKAWRKTDKEMVEVQEKNRDELLEKAEGLKALIELLKIKVESGDAATAAGDGRKLSEIIEDLPRELGIRQKARDAAEQSNAEVQAKNFSEKEQADFVKLAKRFLGAGEVDFGKAQSLLRSMWDNGNWQGNLLLSRLQPTELELALKVYFGSATRRNLSPEQAFRLAEALSRTSSNENFGVVLSQSEGAGRLDLVRSQLGDFTAETVKDGDVVLLSTHSTRKTKELAIGRQELADFVEQAKKDWQETGGTARTMPKSSQQLSDSQLYFDPETRSYQTWIVDGRGLSKVRVTLDAAGEVEAVHVKYALRPSEGKGTAARIPDALADYKSKGGEPIQVERQKVDYQALAKELPFEIKSPTWAYRALRGANRVGDGVSNTTSWVGNKIPRPRMPKFGAKADPTAKAEAKSEAKPDETQAEGAKTEAKPNDRNFLRGAVALLGKIPGFGSRKPAAKPVAKPDSKPAPTQPDVAPPPASEVKPGTTRPTLPDGLQFPPAQVGSGERSVPLSSREISQSANEVMGEYAGRTHEGVGRERNEDGVGMAYTNERDLVLTAVDGMGGHVGGKEAAQLSLATINEAVQVNGDLPAAMIQAHGKVVSALHPSAPKGRKPGACVGAVKIRRPDTADGPYTMEAHWGGDVKIVVLRKGPDGKRRWIYQNAEDNHNRMVVDFEIASGKIPKENRDLEIVTREGGNTIYNPIGGDRFSPHGTHEGFVPDASGHPVSAKDLSRIPLETGDVVMVLPDGTSKNLKDMQVLIDLIEGKESAAEITKTIDAWVEKRMKQVHEVDQAYEKGVVQPDQRQGLFVNGVQRFMDNNGNVFEVPQGGKAIDHFETDNFSAMVYVHNPKLGSKPKVESDPGIQPPSDTSRTEDDVTSIFRKPE